MDFAGSPHGYYCLAEPSPGCEQPFSVSVEKPSVSGAAAATYCGINEELASCEAVLALVSNWRCSGQDGMCSPDGVEPEQAVPGAICRQVDLLANRCTYACAGTQQCLPSSPGDTCGDGDTTPPGWCGG
jgi:hypothetical protein